MRGLIALGTFVWLLATPARAHHGWGSYEANQPETLKGTIEQVQPSGPHAVIWLKVGTKSWEVVLAPPSRMANRGLPATELKVGEAVEIYGYPHRSRGDEVRAEWIRTAASPLPIQLR